VRIGGKSAMAVGGIDAPGRRTFSVAGARVWNTLPADVTSAPSLFTFRKRLKLHFFHFLSWHCPLNSPCVVLAVAVC